MKVFQVVDTLYAIGNTQRLGLGVAIKADATGTFAGVWVGELVLDSVHSC